MKWAFLALYAPRRYNPGRHAAPGTPGGLPRSQAAENAAFSIGLDEDSKMATVQELKATVRPKGGKGAARAARRSGRVPGVIYGENKPPVMVSIDHDELRKRIYAGRFLTTLYDLDMDGDQAPRHPARLPARSGQGPADARGFPPRGGRRRDPRQRRRSRCSTPISRPASSAAARSTSSPTRSK